ncbi:MAG TPA: AAA family ATPase [Streptosporangiaceae bacterium]
MTGHFVGRARELRLFDEAMAAARGGEGRLVMVTGEAGIGKTRLCREVARRAEKAGVVVAWGTCWPDAGAPPLWPWQAILTDLSSAHPEAAPATGPSKGDAAGALLADDSGGPIVDPERFARFTTVTDQMVRACLRTPALVVIDDVHAADPGAVLLARFIARHLGRLPVVLLFTRRPDEPDGDDRGDVASPGPLRDLENDATVVTMRRFTLVETRAFLRSYGYINVDPDLQRALWRLTGGNPLFLRRVIALGPSHQAAGKIPRDDVETIVAQTVSRLDEDTRHILSRAAVLGPSPLAAEVTAVAGCPKAVLTDALNKAERSGLVAIDEQERFSFTHELVRECLQDGLTVHEWSEAHAKAADMLWQSYPTADARQLARLAHHAVRAATRSTDDARRAIAACQAAATAMMRGFSYERAASVLAAAMDVREQARLPDPAATLLVEWAWAVQSSGRLTEARALFDRAARSAVVEQNTVELARAALGLGGVWVGEHRSRAEWERVIGLQRRALAGLPATEHRLRSRLSVRLAAEDVYRGAPVEPVLRAVEEARGLNDGAVLAEALSLCHHALLTPRHTRTRLELAEELIAVASPAGEGMLALMGLCWRAVDLFHLGDRRAPRALAELREHADALNCRSVLYVADVIDTMLLIRAGRLAEAETKAMSSYELGTQVGDADALGYLGAHLVTIRWLQDRDAEMLTMVEDIVDSPTLVTTEFAFQATVAGVAARAGEHDKARLVLDKLTASGVANLPESSTWLAGMQTIAETAYLIGDPDLAREAYELLAPYAELPIMPSLAVTCLGSAERPLGLAALAFGRPDLAIEHLDRAVAANRLLGNLPVTAIAMTDLAEALLRRGHAADRERAVELLAAARQDAAALGMTARSAAWQGRLHDLAARSATIRRQGRHWQLALDGHHAIVPHRIGMTYLARLLTNPGQEISALELAVDATSPVASLTASTHQPMIDDQARAAYRRRAAELTDELAEAERNADLARAERLRAELEALVDELERVSAKGGRTRTFADPQERARTAVRKAIKRAIDEITTVDPTTGNLLQSSVTTGTTCCYTPDPEQPLTWSLEDDT